MSKRALHLDREAVGKLRQLRGGELFAKLVNLFETNVDEQLEVLKVSSREPEQIARAAHSIKSSAANFGALHLIWLAERLEKQGKEGKPLPFELFRELKVEFSRVLESLREETLK